MANILAGVGIAGSIAGSALGYASASETGAANAQMYQYQSAIALQNARIAKQNAAYTRMAGEQQASNVGTQGRAVVGQTRDAQAASGLNVNTGSAKDVVTSEHLVGSAEQTAVRSNSMLQAYGYEVQAAQDKSQAAEYQTAASYAQQSASIGEVSSIIGGATSVASKWLQASQSGAFSGGGMSMPNPTYGGGSWGISF